MERNKKRQDHEKTGFPEGYIGDLYGLETQRASTC